ncbi:MAG: FAD-dependent 5-carboxymethylaminomethyl-2-thiouridine(34) oxidoreductase MnmC [Polaromonas sp.]|nr:FAD-dependent 5-carboxymethylaminomethyl-2-thiouridine(34) oxidoreductase MnmC [Polaromonas sp.]
MPEQEATQQTELLVGFDLPRSWAGQCHFTLLEVGHRSWLNFLTLWQVWRADPHRPRLLHHVALTAHPTLPAALPTAAPQLQPLADQLQAALWGLLPGFHRLAFEDGQVLLTVCVGDTQALLRQHAFAADGVWINFDAPLAQASVHDFKAIATCCRRGTRVVARHTSPETLKHLTQCGFTTLNHADLWRGEFNPPWQLKHHATAVRFNPGTCTVIGAGLAGAAVAASLARRGWRVTVLDAASAPASGASGLPAGVVAPHISPDDSLLSTLSRAGVRVTLQQAENLLDPEQDWALTGVLERCLDHPRRLPAAWSAGGTAASATQDWVQPASEVQLAACGLAGGDKEAALWHAKAGWIKPAQLVNAWLRTPGVQWLGSSTVGVLQRVGTKWQAISMSGDPLASSDLVVLAAGYATAALVAPLSPTPLALQAIRGQVSWALHAPGTANACPVFPVNGHGHLLANLPLDTNPNGITNGRQPAWLIGSSFERDSTSVAPQASDNHHNLHRLQTLLPHCAQILAQPPSAMQAWAGVRCATPTRLPSVGAIPNAEGMWVCTGMGSRGLTFAALCGELLAAQLHGEPWPVEKRLAKALRPSFQAVERLAR